MKKKTSVILLPAKDANIIKRNQLWTHNNGGDTHLHSWNNPDEKVKDHELKGYCIPQYLYICSDEEIKEGDWCEDNGGIYQIIDKNHLLTVINFGNAKKIIATTDSSLIAMFGHDGEIYGKMKEGLPSIPKAFIDYYIEQYNKGHVITKALVEYEYSCEAGHIMSYHTTCSYPHCNKQNKLTLKLNNNEIVIVSAKDSWTREEMEIIKKEAFFKGQECESLLRRGFKTEGLKMKFDYFK